MTELKVENNELEGEPISKIEEDFEKLPEDIQALILKDLGLSTKGGGLTAGIGAYLTSAATVTAGCSALVFLAYSALDLVAKQSTYVEFYGAFLGDACTVQQERDDSWNKWTSLIPPKQLKKNVFCTELNGSYMEI